MVVFCVIFLFILTQFTAVVNTGYSMDPKNLRMVVLCFHRLWHPVLTLATPWETWHEQVGVTLVFTVFGKRRVVDPGKCL